MEVVNITKEYQGRAGYDPDQLVLKLQHALFNNLQESVLEEKYQPPKPAVDTRNVEYAEEKTIKR